MKLPEFIDLESRLVPQSVILPQIKVAFEGKLPELPAPKWVHGWVVPELAGAKRTMDDEACSFMFRATHRTQQPSGFVNLVFLAEYGLLTRCLSLDEGQDLIRRGIPRQFDGEHLLLWRSAAYDRAGNLFAPFIQNIKGQHPVVYWWWLEYDLYPSHTTPLLSAA